MISLSNWLNTNYIDKGIARSNAVIDMSRDLNASYSTVYSWLRSGEYYVQHSNESGKVSVYREVRSVQK